MEYTSPSKLKFQLTSDPSYLLSFILQAGGVPILNRMNGMGLMHVTDEDTAFEQIAEWIENGENQKIIDALSVPFNPENIYPEYHSAMFEAATEIQNASAPSTRLSVLGNEVDANNILGALAGGLTGFMQANQPLVNGQQPYNGQYPPNPQRQDNTMAWVLGGIAVVVIGVILYMAFKK